jgi:leucine zipper transcription factor-like protein 1
LDSTFTLEEVEDVLSDISNEVSTEIESELINSAHTNVLLLQQIFKQAEKWHLNLDADLAELENRYIKSRLL